MTSVVSLTSLSGSPTHTRTLWQENSNFYDSSMATFPNKALYLAPEWPHCQSSNEFLSSSFFLLVKTGIQQQHYWWVKLTSFMPLLCRLCSIAWQTNIYLSLCKKMHLYCRKGEAYSKRIIYTRNDNMIGHIYLELSNTVFVSFYQYRFYSF